MLCLCREREKEIKELKKIYKCISKHNSSYVKKQILKKTHHFTDQQQSLKPEHTTFQKTQ